MFEFKCITFDASEFRSPGMFLPVHMKISSYKYLASIGTCSFDVGQFASASNAPPPYQNPMANLPNHIPHVHHQHIPSKIIALLWTYTVRTKKKKETKFRSTISQNLFKKV